MTQTRLTGSVCEDLFSLMAQKSAISISIPSVVSAMHVTNDIPLTVV